MSSQWIDDKTCRYNTSEQGSQAWKDLRKGLLTGSNFGTAAGHSPYQTRDSYLQEFTSGVDKVFSARAQEHMARGRDLEPVVRQLYEHFKVVKVQEVGLAIPRWDDSIGSSVDGLVGTDGCIEIKCPAVMYPLIPRKELPLEVRIPVTHYDQMQGAMAITGRSWCDYVVYCKDTNELQIHRLDFDQEYWDQDLYPKLKSFLRDVKYERRQHQ